MFRLTPARTTLRSFSTSTRQATSVPVRAVGTEGQIIPSERPEGHVVQAGVVSGAPVELHRRPVRIFRPTVPVTQSAKATSHHWRVDWDILQGSGRWENPLMGWASSADYMQGTHVKFDSKTDAIAFCEKQGWEFYVQEPNVQKFEPKSYANNYKYVAKDLRICHTK
ncbi:ETC complex I subunit [Sporobolomyces salmoneus]|uniref:ETC complex I subunit n=1 Tax=Sporobolomyces salmoneus TaxID=183962 RepID=UPI00318056CF